MTRFSKILLTVTKLLLTSERNNSLSNCKFILLLFSQLLDDDILTPLCPRMLHRLLLAVYEEVFLPRDLNIVVVNNTNFQLVIVVL